MASGAADHDTRPVRDNIELWTVLEPLREERERIERILDRLDVTEDLVERADLASELVRSSSRYEDTVERALEPSLDGQVPEDLLRRHDQDRESLRASMTVIHERTMHVDPRNVHAPDPQGFEDTLEEVSRRLREQLPAEDRLLSGYVATLSAEERHELAQKVESAQRTASERPRPPRTAVGRAISNAHVKLDHNLEDVSTPRHPGQDTVEGTGPQG